MKQYSVKQTTDLEQNMTEPPCDKTNKMACEPSDDSDQPGHPPSLNRVFSVRMKKAWVLSYPLSAQRRLWSDWADAQADLSRRWGHMSFYWFWHEVAHVYLETKVMHGPVLLCGFVIVEHIQFSEQVIWPKLACIKNRNSWLTLTSDPISGARH